MHMKIDVVKYAEKYGFGVYLDTDAVTFYKGDFNAVWDLKEGISQPVPDIGDPNGSFVTTDFESFLAHIAAYTISTEPGAAE